MLNKRITLTEKEVEEMSRDQLLKKITDQIENDKRNFSRQETLFNNVHEDEVGVQFDSFWESFACNFSGEVACAAGCVASFAAPVAGWAIFGACTQACSLVWGSGLC